jgi:hypothetical protein
MQDPHLAQWWAQAAEFRSGGNDRLLRPAPWTRTIEELCADGVTGEVYAHEHVTVAPGETGEYFDALRQFAIPAYEQFGWQLVGAWETFMSNDSECFVVWAIPTWEQWAALEGDQRSNPSIVQWVTQRREMTESFDRFLMVDAPLSPLRTHRQPAFSDQIHSPEHS